MVTTPDNAPSAPQNVPAAPPSAPESQPPSTGGYRGGGGGGQGGYGGGGQGGRSFGAGQGDQGSRGRGGPRREERATPTDAEGNEISEKVVFINRCAKVVKGGRRFSFSALVVSGNKVGKVGVGFGKAKERAEAVKKAIERAR